MKKRIYSIYPILLACGLWLMASCNDFVDVIPKGNTIPSTVDDLGKMMNNGSMAIYGENVDLNSVAYGMLWMACYSDDYAATENPNSALYTSFSTNPILQNLLKWADYIYSAGENDYNWDGLYKSNYIVNYVLDHIDEVEEGMSYRREEVKGEALVHRAMNYFLLTNVYGKQYNASTSETDLSVPLVLEADINKQYPRATVAQVYSQILSDLDEALTLLSTDVPDYNHIPGRATAYALRARVYLWQQNYGQAYKDACAALNLRSMLIDYNTVQLAMPGIPAYGAIGYDMNIETNPEIMYARYATESAKVSYSDKMLAIIDQENDLRYTLFVGALPESAIFEPVEWTRFGHSGIDVSEVWLTKAEAAVRKSNPDIAAALEALNYVRQNRYRADAYQPYAVTDPDTLLDEILKERRRELNFTEMAFFDRKRQNADPKTARPMERTYLGVTYTLPVGDPHYEFAIPLNVMALNPQLIQNER